MSHYLLHKEIPPSLTNKRFLDGTMCAEIIAADHNGYGIEGVAAYIDLKIMSLCVLSSQNSIGGGKISSIIDAIKFAEKNGAQICNLSLGTNFYSPELYDAKQMTKNVKLAKQIARCTVAAIAIAVGVLVPGAVAGIASGAASAIASESVLSDGDVLKIIAKVYYHKTKKKFMVTNSIGCQKEVSSFYGKNTNHRLYKKLYGCIIM